MPFFTKYADQKRQATTKIVSGFGKVCFVSKLESKASSHPLQRHKKPRHEYITHFFIPNFRFKHPISPNRPHLKIPLLFALESHAHSPLLWQ
jgi:hypothetical protein